MLMENTFQRGHHHHYLQSLKESTVVIHGSHLKAEQSLSLQSFSTAKIKCLEQILIT